MLLPSATKAWRGLVPPQLHPQSLQEPPQRNEPVYMYQGVREEPHPLGDLVLDEDGEIVGRERAVERVASSIKALQDRGALRKQTSATPPPRTAPEGLLPRTVLPPSLSSQRFAALRGHSTHTNSASAQPVQWMAVVAAACFAIATTGLSPSRAAETVAAPSQQQQQQVGIMGATQQLSDELVASTPASSAAASMSVQQVEDRLKSIPVTAIVNPEGQPYMIDKARPVKCRDSHSASRSYGATTATCYGCTRSYSLY